MKNAEDFKPGTTYKSNTGYALHVVGHTGSGMVQTCPHEVVSGMGNVSITDWEPDALQATIDEQQMEAVGQ